jgi:hypothetical protein
MKRRLRKKLSLGEFAAEEQGLTLTLYLELLGRDMQQNPRRMVAMTPQLAADLAALTAGVWIRSDTEILGPVSL